jgi:hypothetical protein
MRTALLLTILIFSLFPIPAFAQTDGGQFWVQFFEDLNGDGVRAEDEPPVVRGAVVQLLNAERVVVETGLLDTASNAARGLVAFQYLTAGEYTLQISAAEWVSTTPSEFTRDISPDQPPTVVEVGLERLPITAQPASRFTESEWRQRSSRARIAAAGAGAALTAGGMTILGSFLAAFAFSPRRPRRRKPARRAD